MKVQSQLHNLLHRLAYDTTFQHHHIEAISTNSYMLQQLAVHRRRGQAEYPSAVLMSKQKQAYLYFVK